MSTTIESPTQVVSVAKKDLVDAWSVLERVVVSLRTMGSHYATPSADTPMSPEQRQQMLNDLDAYFSPELCRELSNARRLLSEYLPGDEAETISDGLQYWEKRS